MIRRTINLDLVPALDISNVASDEYAVCPFADCGALMCFDGDRGELVCPDCRVSASDAAERAWAEVAL